MANRPDSDEEPEKKDVEGDDVAGETTDQPTGAGVEDGDSIEGDPDRPGEAGDGIEDAEIVGDTGPADEAETAARPEDGETAGRAEDGETAVAVPEDDGRHDDTADATAAALATAPLVSDGRDHAPEQAAAETPGASGTESDDEDHSRSLAGRVLTWLILLIVGGGIALWAAPRVAPHLPAFADPIKPYLLPGEQLGAQELAALEGRLGERIDGIVPGVSPDTAETLIESAVAAAEERAAAVQAELETEIEALQGRIVEMSDRIEATDGASVEGRLAQVETQLDGVAAQLGALEARPTGEGGVTAVPEVTEEELTALRARIEGVQAEIASLSGMQGELAQRIDEVEVAVRRRLDEAEAEVAEAEARADEVRSGAEARGALTAIRAALFSGSPYDEALATLDANTEADVPEGLAAPAASGVATLGALQAAFPDAASAALKSAIREGRSEGLGGRVAAFLEAQVAARSLTPREGTDTDAVLSRAEAALREGNLGAALSELDGLPEVAAAAPEMDAWLSRARARAAALAEFNQIDAALAGSN